ncbi:uncharacterized protein LOC133876081, partial [Alnus glutinosa]|uniref:uncharacterized protein LOC133876081 n=1 Tax=Alnus glutinosa TaxID=3517 RepID=UPI002D78DC67
FIKNIGNFLHGGATATLVVLVDLVGSAVIYIVGAPATEISVEINVSYLDAAYADEEIEIETRAFCVGKAVGVVSVELRKKKTGKIIAQGHHTKYLVVSTALSMRAHTFWLQKSELRRRSKRSREKTIASKHHPKTVLEVPITKIKQLDF